MTDKKLTDNEIKKALNVCVGMQNDCGDCPLLEYSKASDECMTELMSNALDLINRLQADNERLRNHIQEGIDLAKQIPEMIATAKAEAYKECIELMKQKNKIKIWLFDSDFDNLLKELTEKSN